VRVEILSIAWMVIEGAVSIGAGIVAGSLLLTAFGVDSVVELVSAAVLLWRLRVESRGASIQQVETAEARSAWVTAACLALLCIYIVVSAAIGLAYSHHAESSVAGIAVAACALIVMPLLAWRKRSIATVIVSNGLRSDAACSTTCAYMAAVLLTGLLLTALFGWWWADSVGALVFLLWLLPEANEAFENARVGHAACSCGGG
jgi:divalent metal cation (Fe/Co/Zn/Cd) transporter